MASTCLTKADCYDCDDYRAAFACLKKMKVSDATQATDLEVEAAVDSECDEIIIPAVFKSCNGESSNRNITYKQLMAGAGGSPVGMTFWTPIDYGDVYMGCWYRFNADLTIARADFLEFFEASGIVGNSYIIPGMADRYPSGAGNSCGYGHVTGNPSSTIQLSCDNLPACPIDIHDPGHRHLYHFPLSRDADDGNDDRTWDDDYESTDPRYTEPATTGITASHRVGVGGSGNPAAINVRPWSVCGAWYIKLSSDCNN